MKIKTLTGILVCIALTTGFVSCGKKDTPNLIPTISSFAPSSAYAGDTVTITGINFSGTTGVSFGNSPAASFIVANATTIKAVVGTGATGDVKVSTSAGSATLPGFTLKVLSPAIAVTDSISIPFSTNAYVLYSFKDSSIVPNSDSATSKWDFGVRLISIIVNSHASGPGNVGVITENGLFNSFNQAPETGYAYDTTSTKTAIDAGFTTGWYDYNMSNHSFSPKAGRFFVFRTSDNHYVKMEFISVIPNVPYTSPTPPTILMYHFRYTYQPDGSGNLKN